MRGRRPRLRVALAALVAAGSGCGKPRPEEESDLVAAARAATALDEAARKRAQEELLRVAPSRAVELVELLDHEDGRVADGAGYALLRVDVRTVAPRLREIARGPNRVARFWAARVLAPLDPVDSLLLDRMAEGLESGSPDMRDEALAVLATLVPKDALSPSARLLDALGRALRGEGTAAYAAVALSKYGADAVPVLVAALDEPVASIWAIGGLGEIGPAARPAIPALERVLATEGREGARRRERAAEALRRIRGE